MRIALCAVQVPFIRGGAEYLCDNLYTQLIKRNYEVEYVRIPFKWYPPQEIINNSLAWRLLDISESNGTKIDGIIATKFPSYLIKHQRKVVWLVHQHRAAYDYAYTKFDDLLTYDSIGEIVRRKIINMDNKCLVESKKTYTISQNVTNRLWKYNRIKSNVLYPPPPLLGQYRCEDYEDYIFYPSRLDPLKRQDLIIKSMRFVKSNLRLKIAGEGPLLNDYKKLSKDLKVEDKIDFLGRVTDEDMVKLYSDAFCVAYTPYDEDLGFVTMESFLSRKPVITCSDSGGPLEFVEEGISGYITEPDPKKLASKIDLLYTNGSSEVLGENGYNKLKEINLSWDKVVDSLTRPMR